MTRDPGRIALLTAGGRRLELGDTPPDGAPPCRRCEQPARIALANGPYCGRCTNELANLGHAVYEALENLELEQFFAPDNTDLEADEPRRCQHEWFDADQAGTVVCGLCGTPYPTGEDDSL